MKYASTLIRRIWGLYYNRELVNGEPMTIALCINLARHIVAEYGEEVGE
jgi:hypothetical protein